MKIKSMALLLIVVSSFMLLLSPLSVSTSLAQQERLRNQEVDSSKDRLQEPVYGSPCATAPVEEARRQEIEAALQRFKRNNVESLSSSGPVEIKVYFHVIRSSTLGDVPDATLDNQITVLKNSFSGATGGATTLFTFVKAGVTRTTNSAWFNMTTNGSTVSDEEFAAKNALHQGGATDLNFYTVNDVGGSAWARFPWEYPDTPCLDGIVVPYKMLPDGARPNFNAGDIAVHEVGHWLGLFHTWGINCSTDNDGLADTPIHKEPSNVVGACPTGTDTCPSDNNPDPIDNFMTDTSDACKTKFTPMQSDRMAEFYRYRQDNSYSPATASIAWIAPAENTWGQPNTMTVAGYARNGCGNVQLVWRDTTIGGPWNVVPGSGAVPSPTDGSWSSTIPSPYKCHNFQAYVNYSGIKSATFSYNGLNSGYCNESARIIWIQPASSGTSGNLRVAGSATGAPSGTQVRLRYRNLSVQGSPWVTHPYAPTTLPDGTWINDIPNANFSHRYEVRAEYDVITATCIYQGTNSITWCQ